MYGVYFPDVCCKHATRAWKELLKMRQYALTRYTDYRMMQVGGRSWQRRYEVMKRCKFLGSILSG